MLEIAGREADIVHIMPRAISTGTLISDPRDRLSRNVAEKVGWPRNAAGARFSQVELGLGAIIVIADDRRAATERLIGERRWSGITPEEVWDMPSIAIGSVDQIVEDLQRWREALDFSYLIVTEPEMEASAPVVARVAGK